MHGWHLAGCLLIFAALSSGAAASGAHGVVVPNGNAKIEGHGNNVMPFDCGVRADSVRYQQVYAGTEVGSGTITELRFRADSEFLIPFGPTVLPDVRISLSSTPAPVNGLSTRFADNVGTDVKTVFSGNLTLSSDAGADVPSPFDIVIRFTTPFAFDAVGGLNLLLDVTIPTCMTTQPFDTTGARAPAVVSRVFTDAVGADSPTADVLDAEGLITQFVVSDTTR